MFDTTDSACPGYYPPSETAVLLLDYHSMFVSKSCGAKGSECVEIANRFAGWASEQGMQIIHCLLDINATPATTCKGVTRLTAIVEGMKNSEEANEVVFSSLQSKEQVTFVRRVGQVSALKSPGLEEFLKARGIKSLLLMGLSTSGCVLRTSLAATDADFVTTVIVDACADPKQEVHDFVVEHFLSNRGWTSGHADFMAGYESNNASGSAK